MGQLKFNKNIAGVAFVGVTDQASVADNNLIVYTNSDEGNKGRYAYLTGYYYIEGDVTYLQTIVNNVWLVNVGNYPDWKRDDSISPKTYSQSQAQALVNKITECNIHILSNNLLCARYASKFTKQQQEQIRALQQRVNERNNALVSDGLVTVTYSDYPAGYAELSPYLEALMKGESIGIATWAVIAIICVVAAGMGTAAYYAYKYYAEQAEKDVKFSDDLTRILQSKLTEEEYQQLLEETKGIVTKARIKQSLSTGSKVWLIAAIGFGVLYLYNKFSDRL